MTHSLPSRTRSGSSLDRTPAMSRGCAVAIDPGERWIGVARAANGSSLALPVGTLDRNVGEQAMLESLRALVGGDQVAQLVIGVPLRPDGLEDEQAQRFRRWGEALAAELGAECIAQNERNSSASPDVRFMSTERGRGGKSRAPGRRSPQRRRREHQRSHAEAAARILQRWLDSRAGAEGRATADRVCQ
ncbi:MAG: pre-16S rRNA-processing nuclease YqgF [Chloroflexi bacterium]|nr:pre-16S rRNA-processing nuclease YqgF [Chloroflexota bacterium]MYD17561.1 pre-16S rRNA-processing nuclease YqgF [Chloroflexota bacterium]MYJ02459.1 pre-16S rRNA-processing nuclease YqgF [Chloroflexota bacterium]